MKNIDWTWNVFYFDWTIFFSLTAGWPNVRFDKSEEFYGTLLHSAQDYAKKKEEAKAELAELFGIEEVEEEMNTEAIAFGGVSKEESLAQAKKDDLKWFYWNIFIYFIWKGNEWQIDEGE